MPALPYVLKRKAVALPTALVLVGVAGFLGYGAYTRSSPVDYARGGSVFAPAVDSPAASATPSARPTATPTAKASPTVPGRVATAATAAPTVSGAAEPDVTTTPVRAGGRPGGTVTPAVGRYDLEVEGSEKVDFGPLSFCNQRLPSTTHLVVSKAAGEGPSSYAFDLPYFEGSAGKHDERHLYRYTKDSVFLDYEIATVTCQGVRQSSETAYAPPQLRVQLPITVGASWKNQGGDAERTETSTSTVRRTETLRVGGAAVPTYVVETRTTISGSESGTRTQTWWYAPSWAMPVKWSEHIDAGRSGASYSEDVTVTVTSHP